MTVGGLVKFSLNDYPGQTAAVIFTQGCNFRCSYCHNPELVLPEKYVTAVPLSEIFKFLESRRGKLDAVVVSGGEPTIQPDLPEVLREIKRMGFLTKLDTNGSMPEELGKIIAEGNLDYAAMDVKAPFDSYDKIVGVKFGGQKAKKSARIIIDSGLAHEFRTTVAKPLTTFDDLRKIAKELKGAQNYFLQRFRAAEKLNDESLKLEVSYPEAELQKLALELQIFVKRCTVR